MLGGGDATGLLRSAQLFSLSGNFLVLTTQKSPPESVCECLLTLPQLELELKEREKRKGSRSVRDKWITSLKIAWISL